MFSQIYSNISFFFSYLNLGELKFKLYLYFSIILRFNTTMNILRLFLFLISIYFVIPSVRAQQDSLSYISYRKKKIFYSDYGFHSAPFDIFLTDKNIKLKYRNNFKAFYGFGFSYKWVSLRLGLITPFQLKSSETFGKSSYFHVGFDYTYKKLFIDFDIHKLKGYALINEKQNIILPNLRTQNITLNTWYFNTDHFNMDALQGRKAIFSKTITTWYLKNSLSVFNVFNHPFILPIDDSSIHNSKLRSNEFDIIDLGIVPGIGISTKFHNWSFNVLLGLGLVVQYKSYIFDDERRSYIGLAPRYDLRVLGGYNTSKWFTMLNTEFDFKKIKFTGLEISNTYYTFRLVFGYRF